MVPALRNAFNDAFTKEKYEAFLADLNSKHPGAIEFRVAETPEFISYDFGHMIIDACEHIVDLILDPKFKELTERSIPKTERVPNENAHTHFLAFDFGVCQSGTGELEPQLIEMQGFPTLFGFQVYYPEVLRRHFNIPENYSQYFPPFNKESYIEELRKTIIGDCKVENVILLEIKPHEQKTRIDFYCTQDYLGIQPVCLTELIQQDKNLFYINATTGQRTAVKRIYNRVIFDDLHAQRKSLGPIVDITQNLDVEWVTHPNWFYRISKFTLPYIHHPFVPKTYFLNEVKQIPTDLENYVLKPLFSFAGQGVVIDIVPGDIENISDPENWILQRKVKYADVIKTPNIPAKAEIRIFYFWPKGAARPIAVNNLARLSKGKMIGVRYNKDKDWVGGSVAFFEK